MREPVIVDVVRTTFGKRGGALANWHPADLLGFALTTLIERTGVDPERIDDVIGGCVSQVGEQGTNLARNGWVAAGLPQSVPATTVDRQCGSSQQAVHFAAAGVAADQYDLVIACGAEVMSRVPMGSNARGGTGPFPPSFMEAIDGRLWTQFRVSQVLADRYGITRQEMDAYALESHRRAAESWDNGHFEREAVAVPIKAEDGSLTGEFLRTDEGIRRSSTIEALAALPPAQNWEPETAPDITAGNSSQTTDGAAAMLIADRSVAEALGLPIRARFAHFAVAAEDAAIVLSAPVPVTHKLLKRSGMKVDEFDAVECNEAFAAIALMWQKEFDYDMARFNPRGGAIAIGHPLGASGVRLMGTLLNHLEATRRSLRLPDDVRGRRPGQRHRYRAAGLTPGVSGVCCCLCFLGGDQRLDLLGHDEPLDDEGQARDEPGDEHQDDPGDVQPRLERQEPGGDQVDDVEVAMADAEDGELDLEAADLRVVQPRENEQRDDQHADDVGHQLVAEERPGESALGQSPHCSRRTTTDSRARHVLGPCAASSASRAL